MTLPQMITLEQTFESCRRPDPAADIRDGLARLHLAQRVKPGQRVALALSSRGIANYPLIVKTLVHSLRQYGLDVFIIPAMGSHGAATAAGQKRVLEHLGILEKEVGAPIISSLEVDQIARTAEGLPVYIDRQAHAADHIVLVNRIKKHTEFTHEFESGLMKMMVIGLGKQIGAAAYHQAMLNFGYAQVITEVARNVLTTAGILCGVGVVEDGYGHTARIGVCPPDRLEKDEIALFREAKRLAPTLPFDAADILIIDEMGKDISGTGFDTKVVGRIGLPLLTPEPETPAIKRIVVCDLTEASEGNAVGVGIADVITRRLHDKIDRPALDINTITGVCPEMGKIPLTMENDRAAIAVAVKCVGRMPAADLKIMRIKNTLKLDRVEVSEAYAGHIDNRPALRILEKGHAMRFTAGGHLLPL